MKIGIPRELRPGERLVAGTPATVAQLVKLGYDVVVEVGAGDLASFPDGEASQVLCRSYAGCGSRLRVA